MDKKEIYVLSVILVVALITFITRVFPFVFFGNERKMPEFMIYLGKVLPPAVIGMLVIYCLKAVNILNFPFGLPEIIASTIVVFIQSWKRNSLISISVGTCLYMIMIQTVFA